MCVVGRCFAEAPVYFYSCIVLFHSSFISVRVLSEISILSIYIFFFLAFCIQSLLLYVSCMRVPFGLGLNHRIIFLCHAGAFTLSFGG